MWCTESVLNSSRARLSEGSKELTSSQPRRHASLQPVHTNHLTISSRSLTIVQTTTTTPQTDLDEGFNLMKDHRFVRELDQRFRESQSERSQSSSESSYEDQRFERWRSHHCTVDEGVTGEDGRELLLFVREGKKESGK